MGSQGRGLTCYRNRLLAHLGAATYCRLVLATGHWALVVATTTISASLLSAIMVPKDGT